MNLKDIQEQCKDYPEIIDSSIEMNEVNSSIKIFEGEYIIKDNSKEIKVLGNIYYDWFPNSGAHFAGKPLVDTFDLFGITDGLNSYKIIIDGLEFGQGFITTANFGGINDDSFIKGVLSKQAILGDYSIAVDTLKFSIPNLREFNGTVVKKIIDENIFISTSRMRLENDNYVITIDKCYDYKERNNFLKEKGGFVILYGGELTSKKGSMTFEGMKDVFHCLNVFLTFLNGRRTSALFIQGVFNNQVIWCDYTNYFVDNYKAVQTWSPKHSINNLNELWQRFSLLWCDKDDKNFLTTVLHWYIEANCHAGFLEGSIIMAQTALELLYNWWIIENKKLIIGKDSENISAANKIRLLLSQLNITHSVPSSFSHLQNFIDQSEYIVDAPEAVVQIRNAIVHSQEEKRKKLSSIHSKAKFQALQLCIWYIEMALLCILDYDDRYCNRCSGEIWATDAEENVPWTKKVAKKSEVRKTEL